MCPIRHADTIVLLTITAGRFFIQDTPYRQSIPSCHEKGYGYQLIYLHAVWQKRVPLLYGLALLPVILGNTIGFPFPYPWLFLCQSALGI